MTTAVQNYLPLPILVRFQVIIKNSAVGDFYGTGIGIWAGFRPVGQFLRPVFSSFRGQKFFF